MPKITNVPQGSDLEDNTNKETKNSTPNSESLNSSGEVFTIEQGSSLYPTKKAKKGIHLTPKSGNEKAKKILIIIFAVMAVLFSLWLFLVKIGKVNMKILNPFATDNPLSGIGQRIVADLTGEAFTEEEAGSWKNERPIGIMINNHVDARPQSGLIYADLVYEIVAEGGITRFLAFYLTNTPEKIGPIRSVREYYLVLIKELSDAMIMHIGWSPQALTAIETWPVRSLQRGGCEFMAGCTWRDNPRNVAVEHTAYVNGVKLRELGVDLGWEGKGDVRVYTFKDDSSKYADKPNANKIAIDFWSRGAYSSIFDYNQPNNSYLKSTGYDSEGNPIPHKDQETQEQVEVKNLIVQFVSEVSISGDDKGRLDYELVGSGKALVFIDGKVVDATWSKSERDERTIFYDTDGGEIEFNRGKFWIAIVPDRNVDQVVYN